MSNKVCFVIMPFSDSSNHDDNKWDDLFENNIKPAVDGSNLGYTCIRAHNPYGNFMHNIINHLASAEVVIAILTELRPNVMYELGVRNALRRKTIMMTEKGSSVPSDLSAFIALFYTTETAQGRETLTKTIRERLAILDVEEIKSDNPVSDYLLERAQDICDEWHDKKNPQLLISRLPDVLPSYGYKLGLLLNSVSQHINSLIYTSIQENIRSSLASNEVITDLTETVSRREIGKILASVADRTIETIRTENFLTFNTKPLLGSKGNVWQEPYEQFTTVSGLLDSIWFSFGGEIESMKYGIIWLLRDAHSYNEFKEIGRLWMAKQGKSLDTRSLKEVGILPGMRLEAFRVNPAV
jgi:nucleoside 2-deoxyribosyltransferase